MYYFTILFCTFFVPFTQSHYADNRFLFNDESDYEVVPIGHKISDDKLTIRIKRDGKTNDYNLNPTDSLLAGKETKVYTATNNVDRSSVDYEEIQNVLQNLNYTFYQDKKTGSSVTQFRNKRGISEFHGIIDNNYVIQPLPNHLRKRRDLTKKNSATLESDAEGFINTDEHIIYKQTFNNASQLDASKMVDDEIMKIKSVSRREVGVTPKIVYPEIMVFVDDILFNKFNQDVMEAVQYTLSFWNAVDLRYREFDDPQIRLYIRKIVLVKEPLPFINKAIYGFPKGAIYGSGSLKEFALYLYKEQFFQPTIDYDAAVLMTGRDMMDLQGNKGTAGIAFEAGVCRESTYQGYFGTGVVEDSNGYGGIIAAAHELGHLFGAPHDEEDSMFHQNGALHCPKEDGYIMSYNRYNKNRILFSPCSKNVIRTVLSQNFAKCVQNNPAEYVNNIQVSRILPGEIMTLDQQCKNDGYIRNDNARTTCLELHCISAEYSYSYYHITSSMPPAEGSKCGEGKYCISGECVQKPNNLGQNSNSQLPHKQSTTKAPFTTKAPPKINYTPIPYKPITSRAPTFPRGPISTKAPITTHSTTSTKCVNGKCTTETCINGKCTIKDAGNNNGMVINTSYPVFRLINFPFWKIY
ncbi:A disintegrin and metalloproteinase with thrombospondin motifs adt-2-like [Leptopilina boulardi]|uniref:A disintegrin and metalloproteinase with thrombospondin motifs adt-2-like n=1 Tax=Leptopilina boulardi TaxID=63433 RepID=UPI0021F63A53|nr:A disintegrin and metalloproteinase with thrombospondin motifs adt-2-like [Leptopilina boulardi]